MHKHSDRLDGIVQIAEFMGVCRATFYNLHFEDIKPYLLSRDNYKRTRYGVKWYSYKDLILAYLVKREQARKHSE